MWRRGRIGIILIVLLVSVVSSCNQEFMPVPIEVQLYVHDQALTAIQGLQCTLNKDSITADVETTGADGTCVLRTAIGHEDKYLTMEEFYAKLEVVISDIDGPLNRGNFIEQKYQPKYTDYNPIEITMQE
jgi:hypothetical protein